METGELGEYKADCETLTKGVLEQAKGETDIEDLWDTFKGGINTSVEKKVPSKICKNNSVYHGLIVD